MSGKAYVNRNKLFEDDKIDEEKFGSRFRLRLDHLPPQESGNPPCNNCGRKNHIPAIEVERQGLLQRMREIEHRTLQSSERSVAILREAEDKGTAAALELARQGDVLRNTDKHLEDINSNLLHSERSLYVIQPGLDKLNNVISSKSDRTSRSSPAHRSHSAGPRVSKLNIVHHLKLKTSADRYKSLSNSYLHNIQDPQKSQGMDSQQVNERMDANLEEMAKQITRLKGLGLAIGEEIRESTNVIETIQDKVEEANVKIHNQNKQMNKILGK